MAQSNKEAMINLLKTTNAGEVQLSLAKLLLHSNTKKLNEMDKMNLEALMLFLKQVDQI